MHSLKRTNSADADFIALVRLLDGDLAAKNGEEKDAFYAQYNKTDQIKHVIVYYENGIAVGCGAFKEFEPHSVEIKRMYVKPEYRGKRIAAAILKTLEVWANEHNYTEYVLETGKNNPAALQLYQREGYVVTPNYGQYKNADNSVCMKKQSPSE